MGTVIFRNMGQELIISLMIHACFFGSVIVFGHSLERPRETMLVNLIDEMPGGGTGVSGGRELSREIPGPQKKPSPGIKKVEKKRARSLSYKKAPARNKEKITRDEKPARDTSADQLNKETDLAALSSGVSHGGEGGYGAGAGNGSGTGAGTGTGSGYGRGPGKGKGVHDGSLRIQYLKEHFTYIRDMIMKNLVYPHMARKMGWKGKVIVAFVIRENGTVENTRIVKSSGYDVLDKNTISTIREVQPFPKPPVKARLVIPIVYKLE